MKLKKIVGLCGSVRSTSVNRAALVLAGASMPASMALEIVEWRDVPLFDADELQAGMPDAVLRLRQALVHADGVLISTPEYNFSVPGGLKNALDWVSRGADQPLNGKPVAIMSAAPGPVGGARMQYDLRKILLFMNAMVLAKPEVFINHSGAKFDAQGRCTDEATRKFLVDQMLAFDAWMDQVAVMTGSRA